MAFRDFSYPEVLGRLGLTPLNADLVAGAAPAAPRPAFIEYFNEGLAVAVGRPGICTEKAKSEFIIAPLLLELRHLTGRRFSVFSGMELNVHKGRGLNGSCDFVLTKGGNQHLREAPIIGILEAKTEDFSRQGIGQCIAAMYAAQIRNAKSGWAAPRVFGARTTGRSWQLLRLEGSTLAVDRDAFRPAGLPEMLGGVLAQIEWALCSPGTTAPAGLAAVSGRP